MTGSETPLRPACQPPSLCRGKASHQIHLPRNHCAAQGHQGSLAPFTIKGAPLLKARPRVTPPAGPVHSGLDRWLGAARPAGAWGQPCALAVQPGGQTGAPSPPAPRKRAPSCARPQSRSAQTPGGASFWTEIIISQSKAWKGTHVKDSPQHFPKRAPSKSILQNVGVDRKFGESGVRKVQGVCRASEPRCPPPFRAHPRGARAKAPPRLPPGDPRLCTAQGGSSISKAHT